MLAKIADKYGRMLGVGPQENITDDKSKGYLDALVTAKSDTVYRAMYEAVVRRKEKLARENG